MKLVKKPSYLMKISTVINNFLEENQLDPSLEELFRKYEKFKNKAIAKEGGRPRKYFTQEERDQARRDWQNQRYKEKKTEKKLDKD